MLTGDRRHARKRKANQTLGSNVAKYTEVDVHFNRNAKFEEHPSCTSIKKKFDMISKCLRHLNLLKNQAPEAY